MVLMIFSLFYYLTFYNFLITLINRIKLNKNLYYKSNKNTTETSKNEIKLLSLKKIIGLESVKQELAYFMDFIKSNDKYKKWNVKLPRGILLVGPPGTGKTLLVKTLAK